jgi:hypothetical protein
MNVFISALVRNLEKPAGMAGFAAVPWPLPLIN